LRDLGETTVGGAEVLKNIKEVDGLEVRNISGTRMANVAKAYGWWIAKDCCTLTILKVSFFDAGFICGDMHYLFSHSVFVAH
jgi:hypothetical protein